MNNPLIKAVEAHEKMMDAEGDMMAEIGGESVFEPFDEVLCCAVSDLGFKSLDSVCHLTGRARVARLNLIWRDFVKEQKEKRSAISQADGQV